LIEPFFGLNISVVGDEYLVKEVDRKKECFGKSVRASAKRGLLMGIKGIP